LFLVHLKTLFFDQLSFPRHMHGDLRFWARNT